MWYGVNMDDFTPTNFEKTEISGQAVLPGFQDILDCEAAALNNPAHERFCVKVVKYRDTAKAYQEEINPAVTDRLAAQKNAHKLIKKSEIKRRINEIERVACNRELNEILESARNAMNFDPADYLDERGILKPLHLLPEDKRRGIGLEVKIVDGYLKAIPIFQSPEKGRADLAKYMGIEKQLVELTGKNGGPVEAALTLNVYIPDNQRG